jgi:GT2 family glycosyltransferase/lipopolysaccharide/colanic/teichoic acid biosynthesis glycosyltransferase
MELSVIIVNYNVRQFLENALISLIHAMKGIEGEIFVVDNASDDGSVEMVRAKFPDVRLIASKENVGFARANNMALKQATGDYLLLINPDTLVQEDTLHVMLKFFRETPEAGLAGCKILNPDGTFQLGAHRSFPTPWVAFTRIVGLSSLFPKSRLFGRYNLTYLSPDETYEVDAISGSFMMIARTAYEQVGGLDETFFMYGEDLDYCYRVTLAGFKVFYVHATKIVHFKGESTRRSSIDEIKTFYAAMQIFVEKHFSSSLVVELLLTAGISLRAGVAWIGKAIRPILMALLDVTLVNGALVGAGLLYKGSSFVFPAYAYPTIYVVPSGIIVLLLYIAGAYERDKHAVGRSFVTVFVGYVFLSAIVFFAKDYAFSRAVVLIAGSISLIVLPGWRWLLKMISLLSARSGGRGGMFGTRTLIVGTGTSAQDLLKKLRNRVDGGYDVIGFVAVNRREIGEKVAGLEVVGSLDNVGKVIAERKVGEVIFSTDGISYSEILSVIARSNDRSVNYRLVPNSLEAIIGKTRIDNLDAIPLVEIEYNLHRPANRALKRGTDILVSSLVLILAFPFVWLRSKAGRRSAKGSLADLILQVPSVLIGRLSLVGRPIDEAETTGRNNVSAATSGSFLGPRGLTGLVQLNSGHNLSGEDSDRFKLYYAKNHSLVLDVEILVKTLITLLKK